MHRLTLWLALSATMILTSCSGRQTADSPPTERTWKRMVQESWNQQTPDGSDEEAVEVADSDEPAVQEYHAEAAVEYKAGPTASAARLVDGDRLPSDYYLPYDPTKYKIAVGDMLEISVFGHGELLSQDIPVAPDGNLYFYFLDGIPAEGRTPAEVADVIEGKIRHLFANPEVSIIPKSFTGSTFVILGKVRFPGQYAIDSSLTIRQAIGSAGGFESGAYRGTSINVVSLENSFIVRDGKKLPIDFKRLMTTEDNDQDIYVRPGDYIYVASALNHKVYRMGAVYEQRALIWQDGMTLVAALTGHGGDDSGYLSPINTTGYEEIYGLYKPSFRNEADIRKIIILRGRLKDPHVMVVNLYDILEGRATDIYLEPGDIVYVPKKPHKFLRSLVRRAILTFAGSFGIRAGDHLADEHWFD